MAQTRLERLLDIACALLNSSGGDIITRRCQKKDSVSPNEGLQCGDAKKSHITGGRAIARTGDTITTGRANRVLTSPENALWPRKQLGRATAQPIDDEAGPFAHRSVGAPQSLRERRKW